MKIKTLDELQRLPSVEFVHHVFKVTKDFPKSWDFDRKNDLCNELWKIVAKKMDFRDEIEQQFAAMDLLIDELKTENDRLRQKLAEREVTE